MCLIYPFGSILRTQHSLYWIPELDPPLKILLFLLMLTQYLDVGRDANIVLCRLGYLGRPFSSYKPHRSIPSVSLVTIG